MIEVRGLSFRYGSYEVLKDISFDAGPGEVVSVMGPNGVGKTTLLKCMCNVHRPSAGSVTINGTDVISISPYDMAKQVAYVPQKCEITKSTVFDTVMLGRVPHMGWNTQEKDVDIVWNTIESLGITAISQKHMDEISGGEFQKVHIARAIAQEPKVLILDEPSNNLDIMNQHRILKQISNIAKDREMTALMTMHDINLAAYYSDRFIFIANGEIVYDGDSSEIGPEVIHKTYGIESQVLKADGIPVVVPKKL